MFARSPTARAPNPSTRRDDPGIGNRAFARLPALPSSYRFPRGPAGSPSGMVQCAGPILWRRGRGAVDRRPCTRPEGSEPHRAAVHRRLCRRAAVPDAAQIRLRRGRLRCPSRRRYRAAPGAHHQCGSLRAAAKQAGARAKSRRAAAFSPPRSPACPSSARSSRSAPSPTRPCLRRSACVPRSSPLSHGRVHHLPYRHAARRQLSLLPAQHQYRKAHRRDVRICVRRRRCVARQAPEAPLGSPVSGDGRTDIAAMLSGAS